MQKRTSQNVKAKEKQARQELISEMAEDAWSEVNVEIRKFLDRLDEQMPRRVFQEKHTTGALWWKRTYYTYWRYFEGSVHQVSSYPSRTIEGSEKK